MGDTLLHLEVPACPACGSPHQYRLVVRRREDGKELAESCSPARATRLFVCPAKNAEFQGTLRIKGVELHSASRDCDEMQVESSAAESAVELESVRGITPHEKALSAAGAKMLVDSVEVGREFCKAMTTTTLGAVPTYLALLALVTPKDYRLQSFGEVFLLIPAFLFLAAAVVFVFGYFPRLTGHADVDCLEEVSRARASVVERRLRLSMWGFGLFCAAVVGGTLIVVGRLPG